jgi:PKD repeat protein
MLILCIAAHPVLAQPAANYFGVDDASGTSGTYVLVPVNVGGVTDGPIQTIKFNILYDESILNLNSNNPDALQPGTLTDAIWVSMLGSNSHSVILTTQQLHAIPDGSAGSVVLLNFSIIGAPGATSYMDISEIEFASTENELGTAPAKSGWFIVNNDENHPPVLSPIGDKSINEGSLLKFTISASDPDGNHLTYSPDNLPAGATFDPATRTFAWTPDYGQAGTYPDVHFEVTDGYRTDTEDITITVNSATTQHIWLEAEDADEINPLMEIAGDSSASGGGYIWVPDGSGWKGLGYARYIITITTPGDYKICGRVQAPTIADNSFLVLMDDDVDRTWTIPVTDNWTWEDVNHWGSGTETDPEIDPVIFTLSEGEHVLMIKHREDGTKLDGLLITNDLAYVPQVDTTPPVADAGQDQTVDNDTVVYFDGSGSTDGIGIMSYSWDFDARDGILPDATGVTASHIYTEPGSYIVTLTVTDTSGNTDNDTCMVTVNAPINRASILNPIGDKSINAGSLLEFTISASDPDGDHLTYSADNLPAGATFDPATRTFSWTPDYGQEGTYPDVHFEVTDGYLTDTEDITITVISSATTEYIWLEAEDADKINPLMEIASDPSASGGSYIWVPDRGGWKGLGYARYIITIATPGDYKICGRVQAPTNADNSFLVQMDNDPDRTWTIALTDSWAWDEVNHWGSGTETDPEIDPVIFALSAGEHVLMIKHREDGTKLDRLLITNDLAYLPQADTTSHDADAFDGSESTDNADNFWEAFLTKIGWLAGLR